MKNTESVVQKVGKFLSVYFNIKTTFARFLIVIGTSGEYSTKKCEKDGACENSEMRCIDGRCYDKKQIPSTYDYSGKNFECCTYNNIQRINKKIF